MTGGKWYTGIKCFRISFVVLLLLLIVVGVVVHTQTSLQAFIGIILIATPGVVLLAVVALAVNSYCHHHFSHSLEIHGVTDGLEFDEIDLNAWHSNRTSRRTSFTENHRHSIDPNSPIFDMIPDDNSDTDMDDLGERYPTDQSPLDNHPTNEENGSTPQRSYSPPSHIVDVIPEEDEDEEDGSEGNQNETDALILPTYEDAISSYGDDETAPSGLPTYQEAVLQEESS